MDFGALMKAPNTKNLRTLVLVGTSAELIAIPEPEVQFPHLQELGLLMNLPYRGYNNWVISGSQTPHDLLEHCARVGPISVN